MAARDIYHNQFVRALQKDGWRVTHDPLRIRIGATDLLADIGAERIVTAERDGERIAVEIKSFVKPSATLDLRDAAGQYWLYLLALRQSEVDADRILYLAVRASVYRAVFVEGIGSLFLQDHAMRLVVFDEDTEEITEWIN